jgi:predicted transcriptional regulator
MRSVWTSREPEVTVREVCDALARRARAEGQDPLAYSTVKTVMERLVEKGHLATRKRSKVGFFRALSSPREASHSAIHDVVERMFGGLPSPLVSYLTDSARLSPEDIEMLEKLVSQSRKGHRRR